MELIISTFNIQNKFKLKSYSGIDQHGDHTKDLTKFLKKYQIDILGVQELTRRYEKRLLSHLNEEYSLVGNYRFTKLGNILPGIKRFNEATAIISKYKILDTETHRIPSFPSIPRVITEISVSLNSEVIKVMNTHIDVFSDRIKEKQLNWLIEFLKKQEKKFILMGDFNSTISDIYFDAFISKMRELGYKRVQANEPTHKCRKLPIDHMFIPKEWKVEDVQVISLKNKMSDHKPIVVKISI